MNTTDYQARRLKIRYRSDDGNRFVHTLNGTAIAVGRILIALMENHQREDGSIVVPQALAEFLDGNMDVDETLERILTEVRRLEAMRR